MQKVLKYNTFQCKPCSRAYSYDDEKKKELELHCLSCRKWQWSLDHVKNSKKHSKNSIFCLYLNTKPTNLNLDNNNRSVMIVKVCLMLRVVYFSSLDVLRLCRQATREKTNDECFLLLVVALTQCNRSSNTKLSNPNIVPYTLLTMMV